MRQIYIFIILIFFSISSYSQFINYDIFFGININDDPFSHKISRGYSLSQMKDEDGFIGLKFSAESYIDETCVYKPFEYRGIGSLADYIMNTSVEQQKKDSMLVLKSKKECPKKMGLDIEFLNYFTDILLIYDASSKRFLSDLEGLGAFLIIAKIEYGENLSEEKFYQISDILVEKYGSPYQTYKLENSGKRYLWNFEKYNIAMNCSIEKDYNGNSQKIVLMYAKSKMN